MRYFIALLAALLIFGVSSAFAATAYDDVPTDHWAYNALNYLTERGVLEGYPDGFFKGDRTLTRYEFAQAIARLLDTIETGNASDDIRVMAESLRAEFNDQLAEINRMLGEQQGQIADLDGRVGDLEGKVGDNAAKIADLEGKIKSITPGPNWKADFRYRWEFSRITDAADDTDRFRQRVRFRIGYSKQINDAVEVGFRIRTGDRMASSNYTLGVDKSGDADIYLDRAYVKYSPSWFGFYTNDDCEDCTPKLDIYAGMFDKAPVMFDPNEMILDDDINVHGTGLVYHFNRDFQISTFASIYIENGSDLIDDDLWLYGTEARWNNALTPNLDLWAGWYCWDNEQELTNMSRFNGNIFPTWTDGFIDFDNDEAYTVNDRWTTNYSTVKVGAQYTWQCLLPKPLSVYGEAMMNIDSEAEDNIANYNNRMGTEIIKYDNSDDYGWVAGVQYGEAPKNCGDWYTFVRYKEIGANAIISGYGDNDIYSNGAANVNALEASWSWMWADNCVMGITYFLSKPHNMYGYNLQPEEVHKVQVDWNFKF